MTKHWFKSLAVLVALGMVAAGPAFADANEVMALKNEVRDLNGKVASLERMVKSMQGHIGPSDRVGRVVPMGEQPAGLLQLAENVHMGGYIDTQYTVDFDKPLANPSSATTRLRVFDNNPDTFSVNAAELYFENPAEEAGESGFRIDIQYGEDAGVVNADNDGNNVDLQQAYVEYIAPLSFFEDSDILPDKIHFKAGRFVTLAGFEVIEGPDNWNISRNAAFGFSIPFTHTGLRSNFGLFNDYLDVYLGVNNGWDVAIDNNRYKTLELGIGHEPLDGVSLFHTFYYGGEKASTGGEKRWLFTNTATWEATEKLTLAAELNIGHEDGIADTVPAFNHHNAMWHSYTGYIHYQITDKLGATARYELFRDEALDRTGLTDTIFGQTYTLEYALTDDLLARGEFRHDKANDDLIFGDDSSRTTLATQLIYLI